MTSPKDIDLNATDFLPWERLDKTAEVLKAEFTDLLDRHEREQVYQRFIEKNTRLVPREFVQNHGINYDLVIRKLAFGSDYVCDFAYLTKSSIKWTCVIVEIELPRVKTQ